MSDFNELRRIGEMLRTQDNRSTDQPIFVVQQRRRIYGIDRDHTEKFIWVDRYDSERSCEEDERETIDEQRAEDGDKPIKWMRVGYIDQWEFVTACFTEQGCKDYLGINGHNLNEPRIYAEGSYRNREFRQVRDFLMSLESPENGDD